MSDTTTEINLTGKTEIIEAQNNAFRSTFSPFYGMVQFSNLCQALVPEKLNQLIKLVQSAGKTDEGDNPYGENDFGTVDLNNNTYYWKIDYYDSTYSYHSEDKSDLKKTNRLLSIMHCSEY